MKDKKLNIFGGIIIALLVIVIFKGGQIALGSAQPGLAISSSTASLVSVGTSTPVTIFNASRCSSRTITTASSSIMLAFGSSTPTAVFGHFQNASTTQVYDSGEYGCGQWTAYGFPIVGITTASQSGTSSITVTDFR